MTGETEDGLRHLLQQIARVDPASQRVAVGDTLSRYRVLRELGRGGFGIVFAAQDLELGREVALKIMRTRSREDARLREQFHREAALAARLRHPHIVTVYDWSSAGDTPYLVFELLRGETLEQRLRHGPLALEEGIDLALAVAGALAHAHGSGVLHLDLKPSNVFLCSDGVPKVLDFGLAHEKDGATLLAGAGTPSYMAPEQRSQCEPDARADVWAFGLLLYELLTGQRAQTDLGTTDGARLAPMVPAALRDMLLRALAPLPEQRYADGGALFRELNGVRRRLREAAQRRRRWRIVAAAGAAAGLVLAGSWGAMELAAAARVRAVAEIAAEVSRIESELRFAYMAPQHDTRPDAERARAELLALDRRLRGRGRFVRGLGEVALGRGLLALGDAAGAVQHLHTAQSLGNDGDDVQRTLGEALGASWQQRAHELYALRDEGVRAERQKQLEQELRLPAVRLLSSARPSSTLALARLALWDQRDDEAERLARRAVAEAPWLYEADLIVSRVHSRLASKELAAGRFAEARAALVRAAGAAARALEMGRSDPEVHEDACARGVAAVELENLSSQRSAVTDQNAAAACERALRVAPDRLAVLRLAVILRMHWAEETRSDRARIGQAYAEAEELVARARRIDADGYAALEVSIGLAAHHALRKQILGEDALPLVARNLADAERLFAWRRDAVSAGLLADLLFVQLRAQLDRGVDPGPVCTRMEQVLEHVRSAQQLWRLGRAEAMRGEWEASHGLDPNGAWQRAIAVYQTAIAQMPGNAKILDELSGIYGALALDAQAMGADAATAFRLAIDLAERSLGLRPEAPVALANLGMTLADFGQNELEQGRDPSALLERARKLLERSAEIEPGAPDTWFNLAVAERVRAEWLIENRRDPSDALRAGRAAAGRALGLSPDNPALTVAGADLDRVAARWEARSGRSPLAMLARATGLYERLRLTDPKNTAVLLAIAEAAVARAGWLLRHGDAATDVSAERALLAPLLGARRPPAAAQRLFAELLLIAARAEQSTEQRQRLGTEARAALGKLRPSARHAQELLAAQAELARLNP